MNNEIKEILEFKENADYKKLSCDEIIVLKDYITNLQQENEILKDDLKGQENLAMSFSRTSHNYYQRIEKAVEYIKQYGNLYCLKHQQFKKYYQYEELLDILNGKE